MSPRRILATALRITNALSLLLAAILFLAVINTYSHPIEIQHSDFRVPNWPQDELRLIIGHSRLWVLHLQTRIQDHPPGLLSDAPNIWNIKYTDSPLETRLTPDQTGPIRFGFASHLRHTERPQPVINPATGRREEATVIEEERITRIPLLAPILLLLLLPALQLARLLLTRKSNDSHRPTFIAALLRSLFSTAAIISVLLLAFTLCKRPTPQHNSTTWGWYTQWFDSAAPWRNHQINRVLAFRPEGWQLQHVTDTPDPRISADATNSFATDTSSRPAPSTIDTAPSHAGFRYAQSDTTLRRMSIGAQRRIEWSLLIPLWALLVTFTITPAAWLYLRLLPILRRRNRRQHHLCEQCGYDLRSSPNQCPECGAPVQP